jgi:hypothetical protein
MDYLVIEDCPTSNRFRNRALMRYCRIEVRKWLALLFHFAGQSIQSPETLKLFRMPKSSCVHRTPQNGKRFIVGLQRHGEGMSIFATVSEGEARRIREPARRSVDNFCDQRQRLQCPWSQSLNQQQRGKVVQLLLMRHRQNCTQPFQVNVLGPNIMMHRHNQLASVIQGTRHRLSRNGEQRVLRSLGAGVHQIENLTYGLPTMAACGSETKLRTVAECQWYRRARWLSGFIPCCTTAHSPDCVITKEWR